jgi:hypothetical protein
VENKSRSGIFLKALGKTILWFSIHSVVGLSPILITKALSSFVPGIELSIGKIIHEGIVLFFCCTICSVAMMDYMFSKVKFKKYVEFGLYTMPFIMLFWSGLVFSQIYFSHESEHKFDIESLIASQNWIIIFTILYCSVIKVILFIQEEH